jgi:hypothetical protein
VVEFLDTNGLRVLVARDGPRSLLVLLATLEPFEEESPSIPDARPDKVEI